MNARPVEEAGSGLPFDDLPTDELRVLAARHYRRTFDSDADEHWMRAGRIPPSQLAALAHLQSFLRAEVLRRMDHPGGFEIEDGSAFKDVAVRVVEGVLRSKLSERHTVAPTAAAWSVDLRDSHPVPTNPRKLTREERTRLRRMQARGAILSVPSMIYPPEPQSLPRGDVALRSSLPGVAVLQLLVSARYWPFARCTRCRAVFVPGKLGQRFCSRRCGRADYYATRMVAATPEAAERRRAAAETARAHAKAKRLGTWKRVRAPGAGRPRSRKEG